MSDLSTRATAHADWLINGLSTKEIVEKYKCGPDTAQRWVKDWHDQEITSISNKKHFAITVTDDALEKHEKAVAVASSETERVAIHLASLKVGTKEHTEALKTWLLVSKRLSVISGVEARVEADRAGSVELAKTKVRLDQLPPGERESKSPRLASGPVIPVSSS